jgi:N-acyl-phosphatidylethanolamine-hydrolysing phospholipase D
MRRSLAAPILLVAVGCSPPAWTPPAPPPFDSTTLYAPHERDGRFFTPWVAFPVRFGDGLRWWLSRNPYDKSKTPEAPRVVANDGASLAGREASASVTWVGHATLAVHDDDDVFLTDPHWGKRAFWPRRQVPPGIPIEAVPDDAFAVVSHNHYDHLDEWTVEHLPPTMTWFVPLGYADWFRDRGQENVVELDWWQSTRHGRWTVTCLPSQHWTRRVGMGQNEVLWCSWLIDSGERRYFFAGDTGYFHGFKEFGRRYGPIDVAMLPIGAYEPRWFMHYQHLDPADAWRAFQDLDARWMLPMHWGTFDLTDEPLDLPPRELREAVDAAGGDQERVRVLDIGERWHVPEWEADAVSQ